MGIERQKQLVKAKEATYKKLVDDTAEGLNSGGFTDEGASVDRSAILTMRSNCLSDLRRDQAKLGRMQEARPHSIQRCCTGLGVVIKYLGETVKHRGPNERFVLGGLSESDTDAILRTYSVDSPLGHAIKGAEVGDVVTVRQHGQPSYDVEIVQIFKLSDEDMFAASTAKPKDAPGAPVAQAA